MEGLDNGGDTVYHAELIKIEADIYKRYNIKNKADIFEKLLVIIKNEPFQNLSQLLRHYCIPVPEIDIELNDTQKALVSSFYGMIIGDSLGAPWEFKPVDYERRITDMISGGAFNLKPGQHTDDSAMGKCLLDHMLDAEFDPHKLMKLFLAWFFTGLNNGFDLDTWYYRPSIGCGGTINKSFHEYLKTGEPFVKDKPNDSGNGSIMRISAVALRHYKDINKAMEIARLQSFVTHGGYEAADCSMLLVNLIIRAAFTDCAEISAAKFLDNWNVNDVKLLTDCKKYKFSAQNLANSRDEWNWKDPGFRFNTERAESNPGYIGSYCMDALCMSLHCIYYTSSFKECALKIASLGGDSDSVCAVGCQIAGAFYKQLPDDWLANVKKWDRDNMIDKKINFIFANY